MEHWQKILIGVFGGSLFTIVFYFIFDKLLQTYRSKSPAQPQRYFSVPVRGFQNHQKKHKNGQKISNHEMENLIYEEFKSEQHEVICIVGSNSKFCVGICAFLNEMKIEYFIEKFSPCCLDHCNNLTVRSVLSAISQWSDAWTGAEQVILLIDGWKLVTSFNKNGSTENELIKKYEEKYSYKTNIQWMDNFHCTTVEYQELWDDITQLCKRIVAKGESEELWDDFVLSHWDRLKISLSEEHLHRLPHSGDLHQKSQDSVVTDKLIDL